MIHTVCNIQYDSFFSLAVSGHDSMEYTKKIKMGFSKPSYKPLATIVGGYPSHAAYRMPHIGKSPSKLT